jgi:hypothetical protein
MSYCTLLYTFLLTCSLVVTASGLPPSLSIFSSTGYFHTYDPFGFWRPTVSQDLISHRRSYMDGGSVAGNPFHAIKIQKLTTEMEGN